ncbi:MAG: hypothetical protein IPP06_05495 [Saprospiraceae bacterium]|nr:hypothetical protein [Candidatus Vicinibacter affinis]
MKTIIALFSLIIYSTVTFAGEPIPGAEIKAGRPKPCPDCIIIKLATNKNGEAIFRDLVAGITHYIEFGINVQGIKTVDKPYVIDGITLLKPSKSKIPVKPVTITRNVNTKEYGPVVINVVYDDKSIKVTLTKADKKNKLPSSIEH